MQQTSEIADTKPIHMHLETELVKQIEDYRYANRFPTRVEAIKALLRAGLSTAKDSPKKIPEKGRTK